MEVKFTANDKVTAEEMQSLAESVGSGPHRSIEANRAAVAGSVFIATARCEGKPVGLLSDVILNTSFVDELLRRLTGHILRMMERLFERCEFDAICLSHDCPACAQATSTR